MDIKELVRTGMFSVGYLMCHTKKSRVVPVGGINLS